MSFFSGSFGGSRKGLFGGTPDSFRLALVYQARDTRQEAGTASELRATAQEAAAPGSASGVGADEEQAGSRVSAGAQLLSPGGSTVNVDWTADDSEGEVLERLKDVQRAVVSIASKVRPAPFDLLCGDGGAWGWQGRARSADLRLLSSGSPRAPRPGPHALQEVVHLRTQMLQPEDKVQADIVTASHWEKVPPPSCRSPRPSCVRNPVPKRRNACNRIRCQACGALGQGRAGAMSARSQRVHA